MKSIEIGRKQDSYKFQSDFATIFIDDLIRVCGTKDPSLLSAFIHQLICSLIDAMTIANFRLSQKRIDAPIMRIELFDLPSGGLKFQIVPLDADKNPIKTDQEMPALVLGASPDEAKEFMKKPGSVSLFLLDKLPKEN